MPRTDWTVFSARCPSRASLARIANKWTAMIVVLLAEEPRRFGELHAAVEGITKKVLTDTLRALERDGMLRRVPGDDGAGRYELTDLGRSLDAPLRALQVWAEAHVDEVLEAQSSYDATIDDATLGR
jgi:DNA-binding HxlR family transcriptional regulator